MSRLAFFVPLSALALLLGACASTDRATPAPGAVVVPSGGTASTGSGATVVSPGSTVVVPPTSASPSAAVVVPVKVALRPGVGRIESVAALPTIAAAGASAPSDGKRRVAVKMEDGSTQVLDTDAPGLSVGDRIEITADGFIRRPAS